MYPALHSGSRTSTPAAAAQPTSSLHHSPQCRRQSPSPPSPPSTLSAPPLTFPSICKALTTIPRAV
eukprot:3936434-Rhodomonas_salina.1